jgi:ceramide glucosyltransferase
MPSPAPAVSILKPLKGADPGLEENLRSFFLQDHPEYELLFGVDDADDPAVPVVRRLLLAHPERHARLVVSSATVGLNPKVNNLANIARVARHDLLLISDSNVRVDQGYLADMVAHLAQPGVGLVSSLIRAQGASGLGGALESLQLDVFVMGGVAAWSGVFGRPCVVGKSMLLRREDLEAVGDWRYLGQFLAEDQVCGEEISRLGKRVVVSCRPIDNVLGRVDLAAFVRRHVRWARLRSQITVAGYMGEAILNPFAVGVAAAGAGAGIAVPVLALAGMSLISFAAERRLGVRRPAAAYPILEAARSGLVAILWATAFLGARVTWRGNVRRITRRTRLVPVPSPAVPMPVPIHGAPIARSPAA